MQEQKIFCHIIIYRSHDTHKHSITASLIALIDSTAE